MKRSCTIAFCCVCRLLVSAASAQELEPRAYWIAPIGTNGVYFIYAHSRGDFVTDPSLPVEDVEARLNSTFMGYYRSLDFFGRSANFTLTAPYFWGSTFRGELEGELQSVRRSGLADPSFLGLFGHNLLLWSENHGRGGVASRPAAKLTYRGYDCHTFWRPTHPEIRR